MNGYAAIQHGGDLPGFASLLYLIPEKNAGFFVSSNVDRDELRHAADEGVHGSLLSGDQAAAADARRRPTSNSAPPSYVGRYRDNRHEEKGLAKVAAMLTEVHVVSRRERRRTDHRTAATRRRALIELDPGLFRSEDVDHRVLFTPGNATTPGRMDSEHASFRKLAVWETAPAQQLFIAAVLFVFLTTLIGAIGRGFSRVDSTTLRQPTDRTTRIARRLAFARGAAQHRRADRPRLGIDRHRPERVPVRHAAAVQGDSVSAADHDGARGRNGDRAAVRAVRSRAHRGCEGALRDRHVAAAAMVPFFWYWNLYGFNW